ncbi:MAG TPA: hypothetical protein VJT33_17905 [bacterium]|nr:hypothetical protein [bacterium]
MSNLDTIALGANMAAITLAIVAIWLAVSSVRESRANHERTLATLATISERAAVTERTIGDQTEKLMATVLSIANAMAIAPEVRKADIERLGQEQQARIQSDVIKLLGEAIKWGDPAKVDAFVRAVEALTSARTHDSAAMRDNRKLQPFVAPHGVSAGAPPAPPDSHDG